MKKMICVCSVVIAISLGLLGGILKMKSNSAKGVEVKTGSMINGEFKETESGKVGGNSTAEKDFADSSVMCFVASGVMAVIAIGSCVSIIKNK